MEPINIISYIRNPFINAYRLLKVATKYKKMHWNNLVSNISDCKIHKQTRIYNNHYLRNVTIERGTYIGYNALISNTSIGKFCSIGPNLSCGWGIHPIHGISTSPVFFSTIKQAGFSFSTENKYVERKQIKIGNDVFIGWNVTILDGISIGDGAVIGAGAVVSKDIPPYAVAIGCPIKVIKYRFSNERIIALIESKWWNQNDETLKVLEKNFFDVDNFLKLIKESKTY